MRLLAAALALSLTACGQTLLDDNAFGTMPVPNPQTDCQIRETTVAIDGGGMFVSGNMQSRITTIVGAKNCPPGMPVSVPTRTTITLPLRLNEK